MNNFIPKKQHLRKVLLHYFLMNKNAAETHRLLVKIYGEYGPSHTTCKEWFRRFKSNNFDTEDKEHGKPPKNFQDEQLETLLNENPSRTQAELAAVLNVTQQCVSQRLKAMGKSQKQKTAT